ncbi:ABC transporter permease (plasmid) [Bradyrhizobium barranii subsp. barranii]|uniref:ABC transporter permease n=1 Tax=Bradyrhizobium barranii subsp. barranii TaxID=2823807 RepID=A0A7Z0QMJ8_9BRAD|nr:ABC transporter permease [Bradyrhizobium barranii]UGX99561.1 ABC transporter permease [Bradyrhizobium barranii subsp. barranii]
MIDITLNTSDVPLDSYSGAASSAAARHAGIDPIDPTAEQVVAGSDSKTPRWLQRLAGPAVMLLVWQLLSSMNVFDPRTTPSPLTVAKTAFDLLASNDLQMHLLASLERVLQGLALGISLGLVSATIAGLTRWGENFVDTNMEVLRAVPNFALLPVLIAWFGIGEESKVTLITLGVWVAIYINTYGAIRNVDASLVEAARTFGAGRRELVTAVILPGALPGFLVGLRIALTSAWLALIFAETINAPLGLGRMMNDAREYFRIDIIFVLLSVYAVLGLLSLALVRVLEKHLLTWRRAFDGD